MLIQLHKPEHPVEVNPLVLRRMVADSLLIPAAWSLAEERSISFGHPREGREGIMVDALSPCGFLIQVAGLSPKMDGSRGELICLVKSSPCPR